MALININEQILSDLVVHEQDPSVGYARRVVNVAGAAATLKLGSVVFRITRSTTQHAPRSLLNSKHNELASGMVLSNFDIRVRR